MPITFPYTSQEQKFLDHFRSCMEKYTSGSEEYELARKSYAWLCEKIRGRMKLEEVVTK